MDIGKFTYTERRFEILTPDEAKDPTGIFITIMSPDDPRLKSTRAAISDKAGALQARGKTFKTDEIHRNRHLLLFKAITKWEWTGTAQIDGEKPELTEKNFRALAERFPWFVDQIDEEFSKADSFFQVTEPTD